MIEFDLETTASPEKVRTALIDFSEHRPQLWPGIEPSLYQVYSVGETTAEVREGSKGPGMKLWAREHYDWSHPHTVRWTVQESNFSAPGSYVAATIRAARDGGSIVHVTWNRTGSTVVGRLICRMIRTSKGRPVAASFKRGLAVLESGD
ncbi:hypothetical protein J7I84_06895 [Arthrobacter sp. ISL-85]|uniref:hypothetical protein n=1 Tax=Arthrobacter sp. ISL-85 TaxID=2819115 RepID=UPI001BECBB3A|nr:hypothetical protein [Arthrobacter sp. ISL-85]MBT2566228.1 hypothetical protein [Arthrobacter sp. ISL-85]